MFVIWVLPQPHFEKYCLKLSRPAREAEGEVVQEGPPTSTIALLLSPAVLGYTSP